MCFTLVQPADPLFLTCHGAGALSATEMFVRLTREGGREVWSFKVDGVALHPVPQFHSPIVDVNERGFVLPYPANASIQKSGLVQFKA